MGSGSCGAECDFSTGVDCRQARRDPKGPRLCIFNGDDGNDPDSADLFNYVNHLQILLLDLRDLSPATFVTDGLNDFLIEPSIHKGLVNLRPSCD